MIDTAPTHSRARILLVDDDAQMCETVEEGLVDEGFLVTTCSQSEQAAQRLTTESFDALVTDLRMPKMDGLALLAHAQKLSPDMPVIVMTAFGAIDTAIESMRRGAFHYLTKPFKAAELVIFLRRALEQVALRRESRELKRKLRGQPTDGFVARSPKMRRIMETIEQVAPTDVSVRIGGETGTGKSLVARMIHERSSRATGPFITLNCAALPENLLESELFGHVKGAFTGATSSKPGLFVEADGGTLFLDEVGDMATSLQAKLLQVLERSMVRPVGGNHERVVDVRVITATHQNLEERIRAGSFRQDLFYRLDVVSFVLPALRERVDDIPLLAAQFLESLVGKHPTSVARRFSKDALAELTAYSWPGNVRELAHVVERAVILGRSESIERQDISIRAGDIQVIANALALHSRGNDSPKQSLQDPVHSEIVPMRVMQRLYATWVVRQVDGVRGRAASLLDVDPKTLAKLLTSD